MLCARSSQCDEPRERHQRCRQWLQRDRYGVTEVRVPEVLADVLFYPDQSFARRERSFVAVVREVRIRAILPCPAGDEIDGQADGRGRKCAVGPDDLRSSAGVAVPRGLRRQLLRGEESHARHTGAARRREDNLASDDRALIAMHVHADIDVVHQVPAAGDFEFAAPAVAIDGAHYDLAFAQRLGFLLPLAGVAPDDGVGLQAQDPHLGDVQLRCLGERVPRLSAHQTVEIRLLDDVIVV